MVVSIGHKVASKVDSLKLKAGRERREDFNHPGMSPSWTSRKNHGGEDLPWTPQWAHRPAANGASLRPGTYRCQEHSVQNPHQILCGWYHHAPGPHCQASTVSTWAQQCAVARDPKVGVPRTFHLMTSSTKSLAMASAPDRCFKSHDLPEEYQRGRHRMGKHRQTRTCPPTRAPTPTTQWTQSQTVRTYSSPFSGPPIRPAQVPPALKGIPTDTPASFGNGGQCQVVLNFGTVQIQCEQSQNPRYREPAPRYREPAQTGTNHCASQKEQGLVLS